MEKQKKFGLSAWAVLAVLFLAGAVTAYMADAPGNMTRGGRGYMGLWGGIMGAQNLSDLNLPANATRAQVREAVKEKTITQLGLPSNATNAEINAALQKKANETQTQIDAAISSGDYAGWKALVEQAPRGTQLTAIITQDKFPKYVELYQAEKNVRSLSQKLGLNGFKAGGCGGRGRMGGKMMNLPANELNE